MKTLYIFAVLMLSLCVSTAFAAQVPDYNIRVGSIRIDTLGTNARVHIQTLAGDTLAINFIAGDTCGSLFWGGVGSTSKDSLYYTPCNSNDTIALGRSVTGATDTVAKYLSTSFSATDYVAYNATTNDFVPWTQNTVDIGSSGLMFRNMWLAGDAAIGDSLSATVVETDRLWINTTTNPFYFPQTAGTAGWTLRLNTTGTDSLYWANDDTARYLTDGNSEWVAYTNSLNAFVPHTTATTDLGLPGSQFKDLNISGDAKVGDSVGAENAVSAKRVYATDSIITPKVVGSSRITTIGGWKADASVTAYFDTTANQWHLNDTAGVNQIGTGGADSFMVDLTDSWTPDSTWIAVGDTFHVDTSGGTGSDNDTSKYLGNNGTGALQNYAYWPTRDTLILADSAANKVIRIKAEANDTLYVEAAKIGVGNVQFTLDTTGIVPVDSAVKHLGSATKYFDTVYATTLLGTPAGTYHVTADTGLSYTRFDDSVVIKEGTGITMDRSATGDTLTINSTGGSSPWVGTGDTTYWVPNGDTLLMVWERGGNQAGVKGWGDSIGLYFDDVSNIQGGPAATTYGGLNVANVISLAMIPYTALDDTKYEPEIATLSDSVKLLIYSWEDADGDTLVIQDGKIIKGGATFDTLAVRLLKPADTTGGLSPIIYVVRLAGDTVGTINLDVSGDWQLTGMDSTHAVNILNVGTFSFSSKYGGGEIANLTLLSSNGIGPINIDAAGDGIDFGNDSLTGISALEVSGYWLPRTKGGTGQVLKLADTSLARDSLYWANDSIGAGGSDNDTSMVLGDKGVINSKYVAEWNVATLELSNDSGTTMLTIAPASGDSLTVAANKIGAGNTQFTLDTTGIIPIDSAVKHLGSATKYFDTVYATTVLGAPAGSGDDVRAYVDSGSSPWNVPSPFWIQATNGIALHQVNGDTLELRTDSSSIVVFQNVFKQRSESPTFDDSAMSTLGYVKTTIEDSLDEYYDTADVRLVIEDSLDEYPVTTGVMGVLNYRYVDTSTAAGDPGTGLMRFNAAQTNGSTAIYLDDQTITGYGFSDSLWYRVKAGDQIWVHKAGSANQHMWAVNGVATDAAGYWSVPVLPVDGIADFTHNDTLIFDIQFAHDSSGGAYLPLAGGSMTGDITMTAADDDINLNDVGRILNGTYVQADTVVIGDDTSYADHIVSYFTRAEVKNNSGAALPRGLPVRISGVVSDVPTVDSAKASSSTTMPAFAILEDTIGIAGTGYGVVLGRVHGINTNSWNVGDVLYVAAGGGLTSTKPTSGNIIEPIAIVTRKSATLGDIYVFAAGHSQTVDSTDVTNGSLSSSDIAAMTSDSLARILSDESGTGVFVRSVDPDFGTVLDIDSVGIDTAVINTQLKLPASATPATGAAGYIAVDTGAEGVNAAAIELYANGKAYLMSPIMQKTFAVPDSGILAKDTIILFHADSLMVGPGGVYIAKMSLVSKVSTTDSVSVFEWTQETTAGTETSIQVMKLSAASKSLWTTGYTLARNSFIVLYPWAATPGTGYTLTIYYRLLEG